MSTPQTGTATLVIENFGQLSSFQQIEFPFVGSCKFGILPCIIIPCHKTDNVYVYWFGFDQINVKIHFKVSILNARGEKLYTLEYNWQIDGSNNRPVFAFISRAKILDHKNGYLEYGKLTLLCEAETIAQESSNSQEDLRNLSLDLQSLLPDCKFSDAILTVGTEGKQFHVHKNILASRSPVFAAMFEHDCEEKRQNAAKITDIDPETFDELLVYIYTGKVKQMDRYALDLLQAADKYQLESLKNICELFLCSTLSVEIAANALFIADLHGATKLKQKCVEYICENVHQVKNSDGWKVLDSNSNLFRDLFFYKYK